MACVSKVPINNGGEQQSSLKKLGKSSVDLCAARRLTNSFGSPTLIEPNACAGSTMDCALPTGTSNWERAGTAHTSLSGKPSRASRRRPRLKEFSKASE